MSNKKEKEDSALNEAIRNAIHNILMCLVIGKNDTEDLAYIILHTIFKVHGLNLRGDDVYKDGKLIGEIKDYKFDGKLVTCNMKYNEPTHYIDVTINMDDYKKPKKERK